MKGHERAEHLDERRQGRGAGHTQRGCRAFMPRKRGGVRHHRQRQPLSRRPATAAGTAAGTGGGGGKGGGSGGGGWGAGGGAAEHVRDGAGGVRLVEEPRRGLAEVVDLRRGQNKQRDEKTR